MAERFDPAVELDRCRALGVRVVNRGAEGYPALLQETPDPPRVLYVRGRLPLAGEALAVVGSRRPTEYGRRMAQALASECARAGIPVVSGLARGIDTAAHRAALEAGGTTWAVLGSGLDRIYPAENEGLAEDIVSSGGALLSEVPLTGPPLPANFPRRNRILAGLAWGIVVVEGDLRSGALITARAAAEQGREVFAVPGPADSELSEGPHELIRQGARIVRRLKDVLDELPMLAAQQSAKQSLKGAPKGAAQQSAQQSPQGASQRDAQQRLEGASHRTPSEGDEEMILKLLGAKTSTLDEMIEETGWEFARLVRVLGRMERSGLVSPGSGDNYARVQA